MTSLNLTVVLAERVMGWTCAPDRFLLGNRRWIPSWRFQPAERLEDAFRLLEKATSGRYTMGADQEGRFWVKVKVGEAVGEADDISKSRAITHAVARAYGIPVGTQN